MLERTNQNIFIYISASNSIKMFVLDEADEMLSRGFKDQIYEIFRKLSSNVQVRAQDVWQRSADVIVQFS